MRLINTTSLQLEEVSDSELSQDKNQYAILSHRWDSDEDEVTYQDMKTHGDVSSKKGFLKIREFCNVASQAGYRYGWCDTCCINKGNSSELAESINSMYLWYKMSSLCVVYLADVPTVELGDSEWFTRGWTLQELIAPRTLSFFDGRWKLLGTKVELLECLSRKTCVPVNVLGNIAEPYTCSVAQRMSWAAHRVTQRVEDRAYSLLGLFEVNMPMIYGEREKAFLRLQQSIAHKSKDESLFAWALSPSAVDSQDYFSIFASTPSAFTNCRNTIVTPGSTGFTQANGELTIELEVQRRSPGIFDALLHCTDEHVPDKRLCISISKVFEDEAYVRVRDLENTQQGQLGERPSDKKEKRLLHFAMEPKTPPVTIVYGFWLRTLQLPGHNVSDIAIVSNSPPLEDGYIQQVSRGSDTGMVQIRPKDKSLPMHWSRIRWLLFWFNPSDDPVVWIGNDTQTEKLQRPFDELVATDQSNARSRKNILESLDETFFDGPDGQETTNFYVRDVRHDWPHGNSLMVVNRKKGLHEFTLPNLHLQISVRLQPCPSPRVKACRSSYGQPHARNTTLVWAVDIVPISAPEWPSTPLRTDWSRWALNTACCFCVLNCQMPCAYAMLCPWWLLCVENPPLKTRFNLGCYDFLYPWCASWWLKRKTAKAKMEFAERARSETPMLKPDGSTAYTVTTIKPIYNCQEDCLGQCGKGWE
ncbi:hypothetical protein PMIN04_010678 [Paraphaeosphaeria minitans]